MYGIGRAEAARFERDSRCFERHSKKAWAPFRSLFHKPFTSVHTGRVVHLILESLTSIFHICDAPRQTAALT